APARTGCPSGAGWANAWRSSICCRPRSSDGAAGRWGLAVSPHRRRGSRRASEPRSRSARRAHDLLDHLIRPQQQRLRDRQPERLRGLEIDHELERADELPPVHQLLDDVIRPQQQRLRNSQPDGLGGLEVDHQLKLRWLFDGKVGGLGALEDLVHLNSSATVEAQGLGAVAHQAAGIDEIANKVNGGQAMGGCELDYSGAMK